MTRYTKIGALMATDIISITVAFMLAFLLRFEFNFRGVLEQGYFDVFLKNLLWIILIKVTVFAFFRLYNSLWRYAGIEQIIKIVAAATVAFAAVMLFLDLAGQVIPRGVQGIAYLLDIMLLGGTRIACRVLRNPSELRRIFFLVHKSMGICGSKASRVLLVGAGDAGASMIKEIDRNPDSRKRVMAVIDDNSQKMGKSISGKKIVGNRNRIVAAAKKYEIDEIIVAIPSAPKKQIQGILNECKKTACKIKILPAYIDLIDGKVNISKLRDVAIEDLLGREAVCVDLAEVSGYLKDKVVVVTGGGGSIGSELCRQIAKFSPKKLIALDVYENSLFDLTNEIAKSYPEISFSPVVTSVRNRRRLIEFFEREHPEVVFHAAAHKHVPLMEDNPKEAILNNIIGTKNVLELSDEYGVERFVLVSTDKAVNPTNVMGATKRVAEMLMQEISTRSLTNFSAVRFGNVLGSNGSVLPLFRKQIEEGGPVTVTHEEVTRYFMTIPEAVQLVIQSGAIANGGEIFILDMGDAVRIMDLAEN
ncbi:MAG: nucleoside-diphosphate sugar epimerase/dehydratase, partial [Eubacteriales bacterium]|nr:nucleoside-diphosphate sugar epimerase/dehydratase [Eubacteriales bacterium]